MTAQLRLLDLFCGMGGWSIGFYREGFECTGVDVVDVGYPYNLVLRDVREYHPEPGVYDVVVASPPCTEFSSITMLSWRKGQRGPPEPEKGMELVREAKRVIDEAKPRFWLLENVYGSIDHISRLLGKPLVIAKPWILWGNIPIPLVVYPSGRDRNKGGNRVGLPEDFPFDPLRSWKRARIPIWLALQIARNVAMIKRGDNHD